LEDLSYSIVKIINTEAGQVAGNGVIIGQRYVITCAKVISPEKAPTANDLKNFTVVTRESTDPARKSAEYKTVPNGVFILLLDLDCVVFEIGRDKDYFARLSNQDIAGMTEP
jgi:hypothetical protein